MNVAEREMRRLRLFDDRNGLSAPETPLRRRRNDPVAAADPRGFEHIGRNRRGENMLFERGKLRLLRSSKSIREIYNDGKIIWEKDSV